MLKISIIYHYINFPMDSSKKKEKINSKDNSIYNHLQNPIQNEKRWIVVSLCFTSRIKPNAQHTTTLKHIIEKYKKIKIKNSNIKIKTKENQKVKLVYLLGWKVKTPKLFHKLKNKHWQHINASHYNMFILIIVCNRFFMS